MAGKVRGGLLDYIPFRASRRHVLPPGGCERMRVSGTDRVGRDGFPRMGVHPEQHLREGAAGTARQNPHGTEHGAGGQTGA